MGHAADRRRNALTCAIAVVVASALALGGALGAAGVAAYRAIPALAGHDVLTVTEAGGGAGALYLTDGGDAVSAGAAWAAASRAVTRVRAGARRLPVGAHVTYSLDGPNVSREKVAGSSGLVGVHIELSPSLFGGDAARAMRSRRMLVAFTIPARVADDVNANHGAVITTQGSNTVVAAVLRVGERLDCYMTAEKFAMGDLVVVSVGGSGDDVSALATTAAAMGDGTLDSADSGAGAGGENGAGAESGAESGAAGAHQDLIDKLTALRDLERSLAASEIAAKQTDYDKAFAEYMTAYVGSYTNHLSGSIGSSTQLTALMGTAGELSGDTPLAAAVLGEADATDALASAHQHTGAADALDQVIRIVRTQGTAGLADTLRRRAGEETTEGAKAYAAGQSQLSQAMIPYSMAYTDAYTKHLSELTGGTSAEASVHAGEANEATAKEFGIGGVVGDGDGDSGGGGTDGADAGDADSAGDANGAGVGSGGAHADDAAKVNAALSALAAARERTGAGSAYRQVLLRFAGELSGSGSAGAGAGAGTADGDGGAAGDGTKGAGTASGTAAGRFVGRAMAGDDSLAARAEAARLRRQAAAERRAAKQSSDDVTTTVVDENAGKTDAGDVMKFAGGVPGVNGGKSKSNVSGAAGGSGGSAGSGGGATNGTSSATDAAGGTTKSAADSAAAASAAASALAQLSPYAGMNGAAGTAGSAGAGGTTRLVVDTTQLIDDAASLGDAGTLLQSLLANADIQAKLGVDGGASDAVDATDAAVNASADAASSAAGKNAATRFLIIQPGL